MALLTFLFAMRESAPLFRATIWIPLDTIRRTMEVNFMGAVHATAAALSSLRQTRGLIVAISSLQGLIGFPNASAYSASKHVPCKVSLTACALI
jgi:short-subunit dehydrogenase